MGGGGSGGSGGAVLAARPHTRARACSPEPTLILASMPAERSRWPVPGINAMLCTALLWPVYLCTTRLGMKQSCSP